MVLYKDYRPEELAHFEGSESTVRAIKSKLKGDDFPDAVLITGPSGCGKTTLGRIIAIELGATKDPDEDNIDYTEMDSAQFTGVDTIRNIRKTLPLSPFSGKCRVWLLDECHMLSAAAQEALLKALEDTPEHVYFILCTTDPQKLKVTLKRRCTHYEVFPMDEEELQNFLWEVVNEENKTVPEQIIEDIVYNSFGSPGIALNILDKIIDLNPKDMQKQVQIQAEKEQQVIQLARALITKQKWSKVAKILKELSQEDPESLRRLVMRYMSSAILNSKKEEQSSRPYLIMDAFREPFYDNGREGLILACYESLYAD